jgi:tetratricopeptide (TPR) repeat protein
LTGASDRSGAAYDRGGSRRHGQPQDMGEQQETNFMRVITLEQSDRQVGALMRTADQAGREGRWDDAVAGWRELLAHPCAHHWVDAPGILDELHLALRSAGRYDEAIAAKREAIEAGYRSQPAPETDIAECLLEAGRREEADALFATLRARDPDDVWLYNAATYSYADVDPGESLRWALDGIEVAVATGDPDQVVMQLLECAEAAWEKLDEPADAQLVEQIETFCDQWTPVRAEPRWGDLPPLEDRPCGHCGYQPGVSVGTGAEQVRDRTTRSGSVELSYAWFPADEWPVARERWPEVAEGRPADHGEYCREVEGRIKMFARVDPGNRLFVAPLTVAGLEADAVEAGEDPGTSQARAGYAGRVLAAGEAIAWPPGRNEPCWCGSDRKYKKCCGPVPAAPEDPA